MENSKMRVNCTGVIKQDLDKDFRAGDDVDVFIEDVASNLYYVMNLENNKMAWIMFKDVELD